MHNLGRFLKGPASFVYSLFFSLCGGRYSVWSLAFFNLSQHSGDASNPLAFLTSCFFIPVVRSFHLLPLQLLMGVCRKRGGAASLHTG